VDILCLPWWETHSDVHHLYKASNSKHKPNIHHLYGAYHLKHSPNVHHLFKEKHLLEEFYLLGHNAVQSTESQPTFWRNMSLQSSAHFQWNIWHYISEDRMLHNHHHENLKS
jgi:hypothetical protein